MIYLAEYDEEKRNEFKMQMVLAHMEKYGVPERKDLDEICNSIVKSYLELCNSKSDEEYIEYINCLDDVKKHKALKLNMGDWFDELPQLLYKNIIAWNRVIFTREQLRELLVSSGLNEERAFVISEFVRKGRAYDFPNNAKANKDQWKIYKKELVKKLPDPWLIRFCEGVRYLCSEEKVEELIDEFERHVFYKEKFEQEYQYEYRKVFDKQN